MAELIEMSLGLWTRVGPRNHVFNGGADPPWEGAIFGDRGGVHNLANMTEPSVCSSDAAFITNYFHHLSLLCHQQGAKYCDERVCLYVCPFTSQKNTRPNLMKFSVHVFRAVALSSSEMI